MAALHCPPIGPKHHQCMAHHQNGGSGSGSGGNDDGTAENYNGNDEGSSWYNDDGSNTANSYNDDASTNGGNGGGSNNDDAASSDDGNIQADDDWSADGWDSNELGNGQEYRGTSAGAGAGGNVGNIIGYIVGALVAGCVGAALVISRVSIVDIDILVLYQMIMNYDHVSPSVRVGIQEYTPIECTMPLLNTSISILFQ